MKRLLFLALLLSMSVFVGTSCDDDDDDDDDGFEGAEVFIRELSGTYTGKFSLAFAFSPPLPPIPSFRGEAEEIDVTIGDIEGDVMSMTIAQTPNKLGLADMTSTLKKESLSITQNAQMANFKRNDNDSIAYRLFDVEITLGTTTKMLMNGDDSNVSNANFTYTGSIADLTVAEWLLLFRGLGITTPSELSSLPTDTKPMIRLTLTTSDMTKGSAG